MKVLILGAKGNLGSQLVKIIDQAGDKVDFSAINEVIAWDRTEIDITDKELVQKKISDIKPRVIINCVAFNAVDLIETDEGFETGKKLNADAVGYLAEAALENGAILVHFSTDYVFDGENTSGYDEMAMPAPISKYGMTKRMGEEQIIRLSGKGLEWYIIRTSKLFGPRGTSEVAKASFFDVMLQLAREKESIDVVNEEVSCFTYTLDLAQAVWTLIQNDYGYGIYHIVNEDSATWYQAVLALFEMTHTKTKVMPITAGDFPRPAKRPKFSVLKNTKFISLRSYKEALREYINSK
ncbi:MAG: dTDP-4-dehydrorhamnose reductase [bacterium]